MSVDAIINWLSGLPIGALYLAIGVISAIENVFPPFPADAVVAFGSFLAARGKASPYSTFLVSWLGNLGGATLMYYVGRRYGAAAFTARLERWGGKGAEERLVALYSRYGLPALFISRFLPAVRALVPPFAGAMKLPALPVAMAVASASGIWFAFLTWLAYRAGSNWDVLYDRIVRSGKIAGFVAVALVAVIAVVVVLRRRKKRASRASGPSLQ
ncbi:MAG: DedA family protein [Gemmatimonadaceae bacterium]|nr:DedA family protein [Gemmatimonadaceae bacterium]